jgi:hypothetical protein
VQFNVGMHFHDSNMTNYSNKLIRVVESIREHSPASHVLFALTTPSPFDSSATIPDMSTCKNYNRFFKAGLVQKLNHEAIVSLAEINVTINDRYSVIRPVLEQFQRPCDIHYTPEGYVLLAKHDLSVFVSILQKIREA